MASKASVFLFLGLLLLQAEARPFWSELYDLAYSEPCIKEEAHRGNYGCKYGSLWNEAERKCVRNDKGIQLFLSFDDGPGGGTEEVLDALKEFGIKATFFINSHNLLLSNKTDAAMLEANKGLLIRTVSEGHTLGDHSLDHMFHNNGGGPIGAYVDEDEDLKYFGASNFDPVASILAESGASYATIARVRSTMSAFARLPYSNNWRMKKENGGFNHTCWNCTLPEETSARIGARVADRLLLERGTEAIGWDVEWKMDWSVNLLRYGGKEIFDKLEREGAFYTKHPSKVVILAHDIAWRVLDEDVDSGLDYVEELRTFLSLSLKAGYDFKTIEEYSD